MKTQELRELDIAQMQLINGGDWEPTPAGEDPNPNGDDGIGEGAEYGPYGRKKWMPLP